jgi:feruloyl esterase
LIEGWADATIAPGAAIDYYDAVLKTVGATPEVRDSIRLFMVPGMGHCMGRTGAEAFDFDSLKAVQDWKLTGKAPDQIVVTRYQNGKEVGKRLVCAYPQVASYKGSGDPNDAANFTCKIP